MTTALRWPSDDLPYGMYYLLDGVLVESDDGWKVDDYIDPMWTDLPLEPCVPEALEESLIALFAEDREFWWSISSQEMFPYTREMYEHHPTLLAYYEQDRDVLSMLSEERWFLSGTYRYMDRVRAELSMPNLIVLTRCSYIEDIWRHDVDTGERVEAAPNLLPDGYTNTLPYRYDNGTWVFIEATDDPNFDLVDGLGGYDGLGEECGPVDEFHTFEF